MRDGYKVENALPAHEPKISSHPRLRVVTTASAHVMFAGKFESVVQPICNPEKNYEKLLTCIEVTPSPVSSPSRDACKRPFLRLKKPQIPDAKNP